MKRAKNLIKESIATKMLLVVLAVYLVIALLVSASHIWMNYNYQKENITEELQNIEKAFARAIAVNLWGLDEEALHATVEGMLLVPTLVGVNINNENGDAVALAGIVKNNGVSGDVGLHVGLAGLNLSEIKIPPNEKYRYELFSRKFPIEYQVKGERIPLGQATIYSNSTVIYKRMKLQGFMLAFDIALTLVTFTIVLLWVFNRYLRGPLSSLATSAEKVSMENLDSFKVKIGLPGRNELTSLEESLNAMIGNLSKSKIERERAEAKLAAEKERLAVTLRSIGDGVITTDNSGNIILINTIAEQLTGWTNEKAQGRPLEEVFHIINEHTREASANPVEKVLSSGQIIGLANHTSLIAKDGTERSIADSGAPILNEQGEIIGIVLVFRDVSESKKLEEQLRQAHKMEAIGTLAGGIAHDFNNILAAILGYSDMALDDIPENSSAKYQIEQVVKAGNRAKELVKHILSFSRKEIRQQFPVEIYPLVKEALKLLRASIPTTIEIRKNIDPQCGNILADPTQIHQVLMNLCTNAAQAMDENGGVLEVGLILTQLSADDVVNESNMVPGQYVMLSVKDTGTGVEPKNIDRIFDPYFTTKKVGKGSGIGLAVVDGIVKSYGGMITVDSSPGKGTTFNIYFPRIDEHMQEEVDDAEPIPLGKEKILVVDDERVIADMTKLRLERLGYQVTAKTSSEEAFELFCSQPDAFDIVISDQTMPEMTGDMLAKRLMEIRPDLPIIICSGYSSKIDTEKANFIGITAFIMKPVDKMELAKTIRQALDGTPETNFN